MRRGQVWIETVIYTLIGISLIALALTFIAPKISETQDRIAIEQTINSLNELDTRMNAKGGKRISLTILSESALLKHVYNRCIEISDEVTLALLKSI